MLLKMMMKIFEGGKRQRPTGTTSHQSTVWNWRNLHLTMKKFQNWKFRHHELLLLMPMEVMTIVIVRYSSYFSEESIFPNFQTRYCYYFAVVSVVHFVY